MLYKIGHGAPTMSISLHLSLYICDERYLSMSNGTFTPYGLFTQVLFPRSFIQEMQVPFLVSLLGRLVGTDVPRLPQSKAMNKLTRFQLELYFNTYHLCTTFTKHDKLGHLNRSKLGHSQLDMFPSQGDPRSRLFTFRLLYSIIKWVRTQVGK